MSESQFKKRRVQSFVRREGRITKAQQRALAELWPEYGLDLSNKTLNYDTVFQKSAPVVLEIGFGMGQSLLEMAQVEPQFNFIGIEVHRPGVGALLAGIEEVQINNLRVFCEDAVKVLNTMIPDNSLQRIQIFFPDPWPKKRHHKRRLIQPEFVKLLTKKLAPKGLLHIATDWENYAEHILEVLEQSEGLANTVDQEKFCERPAYRPKTKFEKRGESKGHDVWDILFKKESGGVPEST